MLTPFLIAYRLLLLVLIVISGVVLMAFFASRGDAPINPKQKAIRAWWYQKIVGALGVKVSTKGRNKTEGVPSLWVANHVSWLDIPVVGSQGVAFLSKAEIRKWPVIGWLGEKAGTVFIQRGGKNAAQISAKKIADKIHSGDSVLVFPEGTTGDGKGVKHFHARIFAPAVTHQLTVQAIALRYTDAQGCFHPDVIWGDESFLTNMLVILGQRDIHVEVHFLDIISGTEYSERKKVADAAFQQITAVVDT